MTRVLCVCLVALLCVALACAQQAAPQENSESKPCDTSRPTPKISATFYSCDTAMRVRDGNNVREMHSARLCVDRPSRRVSRRWPVGRNETELVAMDESNNKKFVFGFGSTSEPPICQYTELSPRDIAMLDEAMSFDMWPKGSDVQACYVGKETVEGVLCDKYTITQQREGEPEHVGTLYVDAVQGYAVLLEEKRQHSEEVRQQVFHCVGANEPAADWFAPDPSIIDVANCQRVNPEDFHA